MYQPHSTSYSISFALSPGDRINNLLRDMERIELDQVEVDRVIHSVQVRYCQYEPELHAEVVRLLEKLQEAQRAQDERLCEEINLEEDTPEWCEGVNLHIMSTCRDLVPVGEVIDHKRYEDERLKQYTSMIKQCMQLCHPDKVHRQPSHIRKQLLNMFHEVRRLKDEHDELLLVVLYIRIHHTLGLTITASNQQLLEPLMLHLECERRRLQELMLNPFYEVYESEQEGNMGEARLKYRKIVEEYIHDLRVQAGEADFVAH